MRTAKKARSHEATAAVDYHRGRDPFECLPEHILHHILSLLPSEKAAARTAVVSKSLRRACYSRPIFDFYFSDFLPVKPRSLPEIYDSFLRYADGAFSRLHEDRIPIPRLKIMTKDLDIYNQSPDLFNKWIGMALDSGARELDLGSHDMVIRDLTYTIRVFSSDSIETITLKGWGFTTPLGSVDSTVNLTSLHSLHFSCIRLDELMLQKLLHGCPLLEKLELHECRPLTRVVIPGPNILRMVFLSGCIDRVEIEAKSLEQFAYSGKGILDPEDAVFVMDRCPNLKRFKLSCSEINEEHFQGLLSMFPLLESLSIQNCLNLDNIRISNSLLKEILVEGLVDIEIDSANLSCFEYLSRDMQLPGIKIMNPAAIPKLDAHLKYGDSVPSEDWYVRLGSFLTQYPMFRSLSFTVYGDALEEEEEEEEEELQSSGGDLLPLPPPSEIDRLDLCTDASFESNHASILNGLLSVCHPKTLRSAPDIDDGCDFLMFLCKKLENRGNDSVGLCCSSNSKCWLHQLKGVEIEGITGLNTYRGPLDWSALFKLLPTLEMFHEVCFRLALGIVFSYEAGNFCFTLRYI